MDNRFRTEGGAAYAGARFVPPGPLRRRLRRIGKHFARIISDTAYAERSEAWTRASPFPPHRIRFERVMRLRNAGPVLMGPLAQLPD